MGGEQFDREYFETGVSSGKSGYQDYRWMPEQTIKFVHKIGKALDLRDGDKILDYGCAKGFMVKAFRILDIDAYGCDISIYAIENADKDVKPYCKLIGDDGRIPFSGPFRHIIAKDVFEHLTEEGLEKVLDECGKVSDKLFTIIPLGYQGKFTVPSYEMDITHILKQPREWWENKFESERWNVDKFSYLVPGMKDNYAKFPKGNGFFFLNKR